MAGHCLMDVAAGPAGQVAGHCLMLAAVFVDAVQGQLTHAVYHSFDKVC